MDIPGWLLDIEINSLQIGDGMSIRPGAGAQFLQEPPETRGRRMNQDHLTHRAYLKAAIALMLMAALPLLAEAAPSLPDKPNIILIMADDLGYECIGANGGTAYKTPVLDGLAKTGMRFEHCYSQPLCTPSRVQIMTGMYNVRNYVSFGRLDRKQTTFAHLVKNAGYATCIAGKWQLGRDQDAAQHFGFDQSCLWQHTRGGRSQEGGKKIDRRFVNPLLEINGEEKDFTNGEYGPQVCTDFICDFIEMNKEEPFLVYYPMILTHCPFDPTPDSSDWDPKRLGSTSYKGDHRDYQRHFGDMLAYADKIVGQIVAQLEASGVRDNTLILFTGDNGTDQPIVSAWNGTTVAGGKGKMTDAGTRVPLIASWPGVIDTGKVSQDLVDFSDFLPTLCDATGTEVPADLTIDGRSFLPLLAGPGTHAQRMGVLLVLKKRQKQYPGMGKEPAVQALSYWQAL